MNTMTQFRSRIAARVSQKLLYIYVVIYLVILLALFLILTPWLYHDSRNRHIQMQSIFAGEYKALQDQLSEGLNSLSPSFFGLVEEYEKNPTQAGKALIIQALSAYAASYQYYAAIGLQMPDGEYISSFYYTNLDQEQLLNENTHYQNLLTARTSSYFSPVYKDWLIAKLNKNTVCINDLIYPELFMSA